MMSSRYVCVRCSETLVRSLAAQVILEEMPYIGSLETAQRGLSTVINWESIIGGGYRLYDNRNL